jgi:uncharacterized membrane protein YkoI
MIQVMTSPARRCGIALVILVLTACLPVWAHADRNRWLPRDEGVQGFAARPMRDQRISLEQAIDSVQRSTGAKVLDARASNGEYRIKILTRRGEVRVIYVDARTGQMR